jgi:hypothetical protein
MTQKVLIFRETTLQTHRTSRCIRNIFYRIFLTLYNMLKFNFKNQVHVLPGAETACWMLPKISKPAHLALTCLLDGMQRLHA